MKYITTPILCSAIKKKKKPTEIREQGISKALLKDLEYYQLWFWPMVVTKICYYLLTVSHPALNKALVSINI